MKIKTKFNKHGNTPCIQNGFVK